jgi:hypothetical protein
MKKTKVRSPETVSLREELGGLKRRPGNNTNANQICFFVNGVWDEREMIGTF